MRPDHDVIRILGICGSERPRGNTDLLLEYAAERFASCHSYEDHTSPRREHRRLLWALRRLQYTGIGLRYR